MNTIPSGNVVPNSEASPWSAPAPDANTRASSGGGAGPRRVPVRFIQSESTHKGQETSEHPIEGEDGFEALLARMLANFQNLPPERIESEMQSSLGQVCAGLGLERAGLWWRLGRELGLVFAGAVSVEVHASPPQHQPGSSPDAALPPPPTQLPRGTQLSIAFPTLAEQLRRGEPVLFSSLSELPPEAERDKQTFLTLGTRSSVMLPLRVRGETAGVVGFDMLRAERGWGPELLRRLELVTEILAGAAARKLADEALQESLAEIQRLKDHLQAETDYLKSEMKLSQPHGEILGRSLAIKKVLHQVEQVAPVDCAVLINGETGTGKELIAQEIHRLSHRKDRLMVLVNCAALPSALVESELFGRERGAYTGALTSQVGRFEVANSSTIFLDEVGELSLEVQAKLLRVLQQGEFQRLGSPKTHRVDVRVIAATNRDLAADVRKGRFREDLYYRLKVFPIDIPPLRQRIEDIPPMVFAFIEEFSARMGKKITKVPAKAMAALEKHAWPGNIRELRNVIEHSVILTPGDVLKLSFVGEAPIRETQAITLAEAERDHILKTLGITSWRIKGPHGAAARLDLQPSTLYSRMQKLGIPNRRQKDEMPPAG